MATFDVTCPQCATVATFDGILPFREDCERCSADLHVCLTCRFYDRFAADECRETSADPVARKDRRNLCEYWRAQSTGPEGQTPVDDAKAKLAALFGGAPAAAMPSRPPAQKPLSEADIAKAKLEALFGGPSSSDD